MAHEYRVGNETIELEVDEDVVAVRYDDRHPMSVRAAVVASRAELGAFSDRFEVPGEKFTIIEVARTAQPRAARLEAASAALEEAKEVVRVAPVFKMGSCRVLATDRLLVGFKPGQVSTETLDKHGCTVLEAIGNECLVQINDPTRDPFEVVSALDAEEGVDYAEPDFVTIGKRLPRRSIAPSRATTEPLSVGQYAIEITRSVQAWAIQKGDPAVKIAILDEGVDTRHEDLRPALAGAYDATDDDGYQEPMPWDAHGTACAGLAVAVHGNGKGIRGVGGGCSLLAVRIAYSTRPGADWVTTSSWIRRAIDWAWKNGADILSNSWGGGAPSSAIIKAFQRARTEGRGGKGCVIIVAAGNDDGPVDFPGNLEGVLTVAASNEYDQPKTKASQDGETWWGSNYGPEVDVAAPGVHHWTTDITGSGGYGSDDYVPDFNGTSSATPIVAGAAGLILSADPDLHEAAVRDILRNTADKVGSLRYVNGRNDRMGYGRINVLEAVRQAQAGAARELVGTVKRVTVGDGTPAPAYALLTEDNGAHLLRTYQGFEAEPLDVLERQSLARISLHEGRQVRLRCARRQDTPHGSVLWGVTIEAL